MAWLAGVTLACVALATLFVGVRVYTRAAVTRSLGVDDILLVASLLGAITHQVGTMFQITYGLGNPSALTTESTKRSLAVWLFATIPAYQATSGLLKLAVVSQYGRLFTAPSVARATLFLAVWLALFGVSSIALDPFLCTPTGDFWADFDDERGCGARAGISLVLAGVDLANDVLLWALPWAYVGPRQMTARNQIGLGVVLLVGLGAVFFSGMRLYAYIKSLYLTFGTTIGSNYGVTIALAESLEIALGIVAASLVGLGPFWAVLTGWLSLGGRFVPSGRRASLVNPISGHRRQSRRQSRLGARARAAQSGESILLDDYPRPRTAASAASSQAPPSSLGSGRHTQTATYPIPRLPLPQPRPSLAAGSSRVSESAPAPAAVAGPSAGSGRPAASGSRSGVTVTETIDVVFSEYVDVRLDSDDDVTVSFPGTITTCTAGGPRDN